MSIDRLLRQNFWVVLLALVSLTAFVAARGVSAVARLVVGPDAKELAAPPLLTRSLPGTTEGHESSADPILKRNPFDSEQGALSRPTDEPEVASSEETPGAPDMSDPMSSPACDGVKLLVAVASTDPDWSFASFQVGGEGKNVLRRRGQDVGGKNVEFIGWDRAFLSTGKALCQAQLFKPAGAESAAPAPVASSAPSGPPGSLDPSIAKGIKKNSATDYDIDRSVVDKILENQAELMKTARIIPDKEGDKVKGVRMFGIKSGSILQLLGMENGDRLQTINGFDVSSPEKALEAYARLRAGADKLTVQINRKGSDMNIDYNIK